MSTAYLLPRWAQKFLTRFVQYFVLTVVVLVILVPLVILVFGSLKTTGEMYSHPYAIPNPPHWENIWSILGTATFWRMLRNSTILMLGTTSGVVFICGLAAFVFARLDFRGKTFLFNVLTLGLMFPFTVAIFAVFLVLRQLTDVGIKLLDSLWGGIRTRPRAAMRL